MNGHLIVGASHRFELLGGEPPEWVLVFPDGIYRTTWGNFLADAASRNSIIATFRDYGNYLAWDFEHEGHYRAKEKRLSNGRIPTTAYYVELADRGSAGLWARTIFTPIGRQALQEGTQIYDSPLFVPEDAEYAASNGRAPRILELWGCTLTATPASKARVPLVKQEQLVASCRLVAASRRTGSTNKEGVAMSGLIPRNELRWLLDLGLACTNNELKQKLIDAAANVSANDDLAFAIAVNRAVDAPALPATIGAALDHELAAAAAASTAPAGAVVTSTAVLEELGVPADKAGDERVILGRVLAMKTGGASIEEIEAVRGDLAAANRTIDDLRRAGGIETLVAETDRAGKLTPDREKTLRTIATARGIDVAREVASAWSKVKPDAPAAHLEQPAPGAQPAAASGSGVHRVGEREFEATDESREKTAAVEQYMAANNIKSFREGAEKYEAVQREAAKR
ncbi:MAG: phage protease [Thermoanaerobaculia bacterium]